ncbi:hypothetical protein BC962_2412 [Gillisia mitskevichiae]|uniref:Thrombospondin type 3 repeat-containing protein n=1 Tax=Gillisia mitskevichiae TaxID=270921 RepID=A0A495PLA9_9FLAO|nr:hypothetical protein [Gillisia mitskevichiae]RKS50640.1 hypothetical protein BC962_2412 [Gillisia mitskevichiae]
MKIFKHSIAFLAVFALLFTSCSKEETDVAGADGQDTFQLQFGTLLNDFAKQSKDHLSDDPVVCSDAAPSYVLVALTNSDDEWVGGMNPEADGADASDFIKVNLKDNNGSWETEYSDVLGLPAGTYQLQYFIVYSADDEVLWVAPREGGAYASSVMDPLPQEIMLGAGTKPYVEVDVLCYVPRMEDAFGYIFFDINLIRITNNYCVFVNYCYDETGREYPANFQVDVWGDAYDGTNVIVDGAMNSVSGEGNAFAATVLCFPLPPLGEDGMYYVRVTVLDAGAYIAGASDFVEYTITQADIDAQLLDTPRYEHVRINCGDDNGNGNGGDNCETDPTGPQCDPDGDNLTNEEEEELGTNPNDPDTDDDGKNDDVDDCPITTVLTGQVDPDGDGCWTDPIVGCTPTDCELTSTSGGNCYDVSVDLADSSIVYTITGETDLELRGDKGQLDPDVLFGIANVVLDGTNVQVTLDTPNVIDRIKGYRVKIWPSDESDARIVECFHTLCDNEIVAPSGNQLAIPLTFSDYEYTYPVFITIEAVICEDIVGP